MINTEAALNFSVYETVTPARYRPSQNVYLVDAIHASTNTPVIFFVKPAQILEHCFWGGGLTGYKYLVLATTVEAIDKMATQPNCRA